eukprot:PITA_21903
MPSSVRDIVSDTEMIGDPTSPTVILDVMPRSELQTYNDKGALPEMKITLFALRLAIMEKAASCLGKLAFIWATVVLLGGFASSLETTDFWIVTIILLTEGARIFIRSQEVDWIHEPMLISRATLRDMINCRGSPPMPKLTLLLWLQLLSASTCVGLSLYRLVPLHYGAGSCSDTNNPQSALKMFYGLSFAESFLFLIEKAYWQWRIIVCNLLKEVSDDYGFGESEIITLKGFLYVTYSRCLNGTVFDGLKMGLLSHSVELLRSSSQDGQLRGARVLSMLVKDPLYKKENLRVIGIMRDVVERLIEMLNFKDDQEQEIRKAAAEIISELVENKRNCIRVTVIAGSMESIASLLYSTEDSSPEGFRPVSMGLTILKKLAENRSNCAKIGNCRGLLPKIIALTDLKPHALEIQTAMLALELVEKLASTTGSAGKDVRKGIREIVFTISNLRDAIQYKELNYDLQILAINTLNSLAREQEGRESIGGTGGVLDNLFSLFFREIDSNNNEIEKLVKKAGEALGFLSLENAQNCEIMMSIKLDGHPNLISGLISVLNDTVRGIHVARILRNLLAHAKADCIEFREISALATQVLKNVTEINYPCIMQREEHSCEPLEAAIGLAAQIFNFMTISKRDFQFEELGGVSTTSLISKVVDVFWNHPYPLKVVPNIRRFNIELLIALMKKDKAALETRSETVTALEAALKGVIKTTSDWEYYNAFSGSVGLSRHGRSMRSLAETAMELLPR